MREILCSMHFSDVNSALGLMYAEFSGGGAVRLLCMYSNALLYRQAGRRLDSAPVSYVVALATKVGPAGRPKHIWSIWHTRRLMGDFV